jgi:hypothetical protein
MRLRAVGTDKKNQPKSYTDTTDPIITISFDDALTPNGFAKRFPMLRNIRKLAEIVSALNAAL